MKYLLVLLLITQSLIAQDVKPPGVLVLNPIVFDLDETLISPSKKYKATLTDEQVADCIKNKNSNEEREFVKKMYEIECEFGRNSNISVVFTTYVYGWITFKLSNYFDDAITYPKINSGIDSIQEYRKIAEEQGVNWIVNIKSVKFNRASEVLSGTVEYELWNKNVDQIVEVKTVEVDSRNRGMEMSCEDGKLDCLITNGAIFTATDVLKTMFSKEEYWR